MYNIHTFFIRERRSIRKAFFHCALLLLVTFLNCSSFILPHSLYVIELINTTHGLTPEPCNGQSFLHELLGTVYVSTALIDEALVQVQPTSHLQQIPNKILENAKPLTHTPQCSLQRVLASGSPTPCFLYAPYTIASHSYIP